MGPRFPDRQAEVMSSPTPLPHEGAVSSHRGSFPTPAALIAGRTDRNTCGDGSQSLREEVVSLVVDHDECGEIANLDAPHGFHAQFGEIDDLDFGDAVLGESGGGTADRAEVDVQVTVGLALHQGALRQSVCCVGVLEGAGRVARLC